MSTHKPGKKDSRPPLAPKDAASANNLDKNLRRLERLASLGTLSAGLAHEIRNALVAMKTFVDLLLEKNQDAELAEIVRREIGRIDSIVAQMLKFAGPSLPTLAPIRLHEILDRSLRLLHHRLEAKMISLHRSYAAGSDLIRGDDYQLEQAFVNLFLNALEAMGPNGKLDVTTDITGAGAEINDSPAQSQQRAESGEGAHGVTRPASPLSPLSSPAGGQRQLRVRIKDSGVGIAPESMTRLFEPFFTTKQNGTGLGLAITRRIIQEHGGAISVESEPNQGATFSVLLSALDQTRPEERREKSGESREHRSSGTE